MPLHRYNLAPRYTPESLNKYVPRTAPSTQRRRIVPGTNFGTPTAPQTTMNPGMEQMTIGGNIGGDIPWSPYGPDDMTQLQMLSGAGMAQNQSPLGSIGTPMPGIWNTPQMASGAGMANNSMVPGATGIQYPIGLADPNSPMLPGQGMGMNGWIPGTWGQWGRWR